MSNVANFQTLLAFTMGHIPTKLHQFRISNFRLPRMHEMLTILTDVRGVCQSVCHAA